MSDHSIHHIKALTEATTQKREEYELTMRARDDAIRLAIRDGVTMYRIAQETGLTQAGVRTIRDKGKP